MKIPRSVVDSVADGSGLTGAGVNLLTRAFGAPSALDIVPQLARPGSPKGIHQRLTALAFAATMPTNSVHRKGTSK